MNKKIIAAAGISVLVVGAVLLPTTTHKSITPDVGINTSSAIPLGTTVNKPIIATPAPQTTITPTSDTTAPTSPSNAAASAPAVTTPAPASTPMPPPAPTIINYGMIYQPTPDGGLNSLCAYDYSDGTQKQVFIGHANSGGAKLSVDCVDYIK